MIDALATQVDVNVDHVTADGAYDKTPVYEVLLKHFPEADIIIPTDSDAVYNTDNHQKRIKGSIRRKQLAIWAKLENLINMVKI